MASTTSAPVWFRGKVKAVPSGDSLLIMASIKTELPPEKTITLAHLIAPKLARRGTEDEPFAWQSRDFLRKLCIGKEVTFRVDYTVPTINREFGTVFLGGQNVADMVVSAGWAKVREGGSHKGEADPTTINDLRNKEEIVFIVFTPALMFASLAKSVTFDDIISWWYMPVNILLTFLIGGLLGWIVVKLTGTPRHLSGLVVGNCCSGNLGNLLLIIVPTLCEKNGSPFGDADVCMDYGIAYASFSMAIGAIYIWSITYNIVRSTSIQMDEHDGEIEPGVYEKIPHKESSNTGLQSSLLQAVHTEVPSYTEGIGSKDPSDKFISEEVGKVNFFQHHLKKLTNGLHLKEIMAPPTIGAIMGFIVGAIPQTKRLFVGQGAPLQVIQGSIALLGDGTIPSITLLLGGNLTKGLQSATVKPSIIIGIILVRFLMLPLVGLCIVKAAIYFGAVPADPLYRFILLIQFALPPAMNLGTMTQLFGVGESECSVIFLWTYLLAAVAITIWSTFYMWLLI